MIDPIKEELAEDPHSSRSWVENMKRHVVGKNWYFCEVPLHWAREDKRVACVEILQKKTIASVKKATSQNDNYFGNA